MATRSPKEPVEPIRLKVSVAARKLNITSKRLRQFVETGILTGIRPSGRGAGKTIYLDPKEVEMYGRGEFDALREYQAKKRKKAAAK